MSDAWYYARGGECLGPVSHEQLVQLLRDGGLARDTMVWESSMADWVPAAQVAAFQEVLANTPPPLPGSHSESRRATPSAPAQRHLREAHRLYTEIGAVEARGAGGEGAGLS